MKFQFICPRKNVSCSKNKLTLDRLKLISNSGSNHLNPHLIFCMSWFFDANIGEVLWNIVSEKMKKYEIESSFVTMVDMNRKHLITKGSVELNIDFLKK